MRRGLALLLDFLVAGGLQVSGVVNFHLAIAMWSVAGVIALCLILTWPPIAEPLVRWGRAHRMMSTIVVGVLGASIFIGGWHLLLSYYFPTTVTRTGFPLAIELQQEHLIQLSGEVSRGDSRYASRGLDPLPATLTPQQLTAIKEVLAAHDPMKLEKEGGWTHEDHIYYIILHNKSDTTPIENIVVKLIGPMFSSEKFLETPAQTINALDHIIVPLVYNRIYRQSIKGKEFANIIFCTAQGHTATAMNRSFDFTIRATAKPGLDIVKLRLEINSETDRIESLKLLPNS